MKKQTIDSFLTSKKFAIAGVSRNPKNFGNIGPLFYPTGDYNKDMEFIQDFYRNKTGKFPELFNLTATDSSI
jgi:hypothetical protein